MAKPKKPTPKTTKAAVAEIRKTAWDDEVTPVPGRLAKVVHKTHSEVMAEAKAAAEEAYVSAIVGPGGIDITPTQPISTIHAKIAKLLKRGEPFTDLEKLVIARLALREIGTELAQAALKVIG